jgi:hypothetical protein
LVNSEKGIKTFKKGVDIPEFWGYNIFTSKIGEMR